MQQLTTECKVQNRSLKQTRRQGRVALYELYGPQGMSYGFELIIIRIHPAEMIRGRSYPEREGYPANEDWGKVAWSFGRDQGDLALQCFQRLCLKQNAGSLPETDLDLSEGHDSGRQGKAP